MDEFEVIKKIFLPLAAKKSFSLNLDDDAAVLSIKKEIIIATDTIVEGDHFQKNEKNPSFISKKLLRVNLSDLAAMGSSPFGYTINLSVPKKLKNKKLINWIKFFAKGLKEDQKKYKVSLLGGDTVATNKSLIMSLSLYGFKNKKLLKRSGAATEDDIYVTGYIGDSGIGYGILLNKIKGISKEFRNFYIKKYKIPDPPVAFGKKISFFASAATDISDGLLADLNNLLTSSKCGAKIKLDKIPFRTITKKLLKKKKIEIDYLLSCGEDYQLIFTAKKKFAKRIMNLAKNNSIKLTKIGKITKRKKMMIFNSQGKEIFFPVLGFKHF